VTDLATALAHEIKNPAAVALAHLNLLRITENVDEAITHHLDHIEAAITEICKLVHEMLTATHTCDNPTETDLCIILDDILHTYRAAWPGITFEFFASPQILLCHGSATSLRMIFSNLIKNAVEAIEMSGAGTIEISAFASEETITVSITDDAVCMAQEKPYGNGLGLAICQNLAAGLGAQLSVAHTETGGCTVTVALPVTICPSCA